MDVVIGIPYRGDLSSVKGTRPISSHISS